jgi:hypothetical protein
MEKRENKSNLEWDIMDLKNFGENFNKDEYIFRREFDCLLEKKRENVKPTD